MTYGSGRLLYGLTAAVSTAPVVSMADQKVEVFMESMPVQANLDLGHNANNDPCDGVVAETHSFDLSAVKQSYTDVYGPSGTITLNLMGQSIEYSF